MNSMEEGASPDVWSQETVDLLGSILETYRKNDEEKLLKLEDDVNTMKGLIQCSLASRILSVQKENEALLLEQAQTQRELTSVQNELSATREELEKALNFQQMQRKDQEELTTVRSELAATKRELEQVKRQCAAAKKVATDLQKKQSMLEKTNQSLRSEKESYLERLTQQSSYCVSLGDVMGTLLWKCTSLPETIELLSRTEKTKELLHLAATTLNTFIASCPDSFPEEGSRELLFISSLLGIIANLVTVKEGCFTLTSTFIGAGTFIGPILEALPTIYLKAGDNLRSLDSILQSP
nr:PREDICTED: GRIP and coiled-coil domain-containing protein 2-like isoform X2 [Bemisia tabaci]